MSNVFLSSLILVTLIMEALSSSKALVLIEGSRRSIPEDAILHSRRHENLKSCTIITYNTSGLKNMLAKRLSFDTIFCILTKLNIL
jgi:hypothetical protein